MGPEYKGTPNHEFVKDYKEYCINQKFTKPLYRPQPKGKAERVIRIMIEICGHQETFLTSPEQIQQELRRFLNFYNTVKPLTQEY